MRKNVVTLDAYVQQSTAVLLLYKVPVVRRTICLWYKKHTQEVWPNLSDRRGLIVRHR